uniref:Putative secreted protein n=1 Tax=Anopheles triannulatus TaxID=58253 RepID=A0A2M4B3Z7_9DIPT
MCWWRRKWHNTRPLSSCGSLSFLFDPPNTHALSLSLSLFSLSESAEIKTRFAKCAAKWDLCQRAIDRVFGIY